MTHTLPAAFMYFLLTGFLWIIFAWVIHQKWIDLSHRYTRDNSALDELAFRELLVENVIVGILMLLIAFAVYFAAVFTNPYLSSYWVEMVNSFQLVIYEVTHEVFVL